MTESEAILQAIGERPEDDAPRLVYADWLEERGDAQGEFIRTQIGLTRGGLDRNQELGLRQRERELLERFGPAWAEPVVLQGLTPWFRRGFPQPVEVATPPQSQPRPRRVQILYPWHVGGLTLARELPFVVGVLANLSGQPREGRPPLDQRPFVSVDCRSFDAVLARIRPELHLEMPGGFAGRSSPWWLALHFERLADFEPARLAERLPELRELLQDRQRGAAEGAEPDRLAALDRQLSVQLVAVLHHPDFQRLEAAWRGLHCLVRQTATGEDLKIRVLDVTRQELVEDLDPRRPLQQSGLFQNIYQQEYGHVDGEPYGLLVGDYEFGRSEEDISLLARIAQVAAAAHAPFVAAASPKMFNMDHLCELPRPRELARIFESVEYAAWRSFRDSDDSRYVALTLPPVRARLPYGQDDAQAGEFPFEEFVGGEDDAKLLWMNAAWAYAARVTDAFSKYGWVARTRGVEGGGKVEGLPVGISFTDDGEIARKCPTEIAISDRREFELSSLGFLPLLHNKDTASAVFMGAQSCHRPARSDDAGANALAETAAKLNYLLSASRVMQYLLLLARDLLAAGLDTRAVLDRLNVWLAGYRCTEADGGYGAGWSTVPERPLGPSHVELVEGSHRRGCPRLLGVLRPAYQIDAEPLLRVVAEVPWLREVEQ